MNKPDWRSEMPDYTPNVGDNLTSSINGLTPRVVTTDASRTAAASNENVEPAPYDAHAGAYDDWSTTQSVYSLLETHTFFEVLGNVRGASVLDLAAGTGRTSRMLMGRGARSVLGADVSSEMVRRAIAANTDAEGRAIYPNLNFMPVDARHETFQLSEPVDLVTAMYLLHYAPSADDLERMGRLIARNLKPGGRFVTYTLNPGYDFSHNDPRLMDQFGFGIRVADGDRLDLLIGDMSVNMWQWSRIVHEALLTLGGLTNIQWHPLSLPNGETKAAISVDWYLASPHCIVLSAEKPS